jgi:hypothetical protein
MAQIELLTCYTLLLGVMRTLVDGLKQMLQGLDALSATFR